MTGKKKAIDTSDRKQWLYTPPPGVWENGDEYTAKVADWHRRMAAEYTAPENKYHYRVMGRWLSAAGIPKERMREFGLEPSTLRYYPPSLAGDFYSDILDHGRVLKRRDSGAYVILGESYKTIEMIENHDYVAAWRSIGATVTISEDSGWFPGSTIMALISEPPALSKQELKEARAQARREAKARFEEGIRRPFGEED